MRITTHRVDELIGEVAIDLHTGPTKVFFHEIGISEDSFVGAEAFFSTALTGIGPVPDVSLTIFYTKNGIECTKRIDIPITEFFPLFTAFSLAFYPQDKVDSFHKSVSQNSGDWTE